MDDLSHWDFAHHFTGHAVAALILGFEPSSVPTTEQSVSLVMLRLEQDYVRAVQQARSEEDLFLDDDSKREVKARRSNSLLVSVQLNKLWRDAEKGLEGADSELVMNELLPQFKYQTFSRGAVVQWLNAVGATSKYLFDKKPRDSAGAEQGEDIDPGDFPIELDAANISYRSVLSG